MPKKKTHKPRKKKKYNLKSKLTSAIRRIWFYGPERRDKVQQLKDTGNKCQICSKSFDKLQIDHIIPCVPLTGFDDWSSYIDRTFVHINGLRGLCEKCHKAVTTVQTNIRKNNKKLLTKKK